MDGPLLVKKMRASIPWPNKKMYFCFHWVCSWSMYAFYEPKRTSLFAPLPDLKLLTPAQAANAVTLQNAMMWLSAVGAGPTLLAGCQRGRGRVRRALAGVGLACAVAIHCVHTWLLGLYIVTAPNDWLVLNAVQYAMIFVLYVVADANAFRFLLRVHLEERSRSSWTGRQEKQIQQELKLPRSSRSRLS